MSDMTYEFETNSNKLEELEWDNVWWEQTNAHGISRVLYIGDSISCGTRRIATAKADNEILFDGFGTSKALDNPYFKESLSLFARQQRERSAVIFNNGLHGWHLDDEKEYKEEYEKMIEFLLKEFKGTHIFLLLTTHLKDEKRDKRVVKRNEAVCEIAEKYSLPVIDIYTLTKENENLLSADGVHFVNEGYHLLAETIVKRVKEIIK